MLSEIGGLLGLVYCLYRGLFQWNALVGKYGVLSLNWWVFAVTVAATIAGFMAEIAIWACQYGVWRATI